MLSVVVSLKESEAEVELESNATNTPNITGLGPALNKLFLEKGEAYLKHICDLEKESSIHPWTALSMISVFLPSSSMTSGAR